MKSKSQYNEQSRNKEETSLSSFYRLVYSQIEEVGWKHLVKVAEDLTYVSFSISDASGQSHILEIHLPESYPNCAPSVSADVPYICELKWSVTSRLKDVVRQFIEHLEKLQEFWSTMDNIDRSLWIVDPKMPSRATSLRQINLGNECFLVLSVNVYDPRSLPECRFLGPDFVVDSMKKKWKRNAKIWIKDNSFVENLASVMEMSLPGRPNSQKDDPQVECGICYAQYLPISDELGAKSGSGPDYLCDNTSCKKAFHSVCLGDWLRSITTTRQSFDVLFGNCTYCSGPVAIKVDYNA